MMIGNHAFSARASKVSSEYIISSVKPVYKDHLYITELVYEGQRYMQVPISLLRQHFEFINGCLLYRFWQYMYPF